MQAAYETLVHYFPSSAATLLAARTASLDAIPDGAAESDGIAVGSDAAQGIIAVRDGDGLRTPIATTSEWTPKASPASKGQARMAGGPRPSASPRPSCASSPARPWWRTGSI